MAQRRRWARTGAWTVLVAAVGLTAWVWMATPPAAHLDGTRLARAEGGRAGSRMLRAARALLDSLSAAQRAEVSFELGGAEQEDWHFIPRSRKGVSYKSLTPFQRERLGVLLGAGLGELGVRKVEQVRSLETILRRIEGADRRFPRDSELYHLSFFGAPAERGRWAWRFEGHHLSVNFELEGDRVLAATPAFFGANPAVVLDGPEKGLQVLRDVEETARSFVRALDETQLRRCRGEEVPEEVPSTGRSRYDGPFPEGVAGSELDDAQRAKLGGLLDAYFGKLAPEIQEQLRARLEADGGLGTVRVAWRGGLEKRGPHSYLVHSPTFVINYANVQNDANHVHSSLRLRDGDFGKSLGAKSTSGDKRL